MTKFKGSILSRKLQGERRSPLLPTDFPPNLTPGQPWHKEYSVDHYLPPGKLPPHTAPLSPLPMKPRFPFRSMSPA